MEPIGRWLMFFGALLFVLGGLLVIFARWGIPLGRIPGDFVFRRGNVTCVFPLATSILVSITLTILLNLFTRWFK